MSWPKIRKTWFSSVVFSYSIQQQQTISQSDCDMRQKVNFIRQLAMTSSVAGSRKAAPKPNLHQKKVMVTGGLLPIWSITAFWTQQNYYTWEVRSANQRDAPENCNPWSQHWSTEMAQFFSMTMPDHTSHDQLFKSWTNWVTKFCLICHIHLTSNQPTTTSSSILTSFCRENASTTRRRQKMLSKSSSNPKEQFF